MKEKNLSRSVRKPTQCPGSGIDKISRRMCSHDQKLLSRATKMWCFFLQDCPNEKIQAEASTYLVQIKPVVLHFLADEYDDTCSTVFPLLHLILTSVSRILFFWLEQLTWFCSINAIAKSHQVLLMNPKSLSSRLYWKSYCQNLNGRKSQIQTLLSYVPPCGFITSIWRISYRP